MAKKITKKEKEKKNEEKRKREKERRENEREKKDKMQKKLNELNTRKKEKKIGKRKRGKEEKEEIVKQLKTELKKENNTIINNNVVINIRTPSNSNKSESSSSSYFDDSSYWDSDVSIPKIPKHPERDDTCKNYTPTALPYEKVLLNRDFLRDINKRLKEENFIKDNKYSFHDFCLYYKLKTYFKTKKNEKKTYPNISKYLNYIKKYKKLEYENRFLKEYNKKIRCVYKKKPYERTYKKTYFSSPFSSPSSESDHSILSILPSEEIIKQQKNIRMKIGPESERIHQEVDSFIKKIEDKKRKKTEDKKRRKDGKLRRKRKMANKDWVNCIKINNK